MHLQGTFSFFWFWFTNNVHYVARSMWTDLFIWSPRIVSGNSFFKFGMQELDWLPQSSDLNPAQHQLSTIISINMMMWSALEKFDFHNKLFYARFVLYSRCFLPFSNLLMYLLRKLWHNKRLTHDWSAASAPTVSSLLLWLYNKSTITPHRADVTLLTLIHGANRNITLPSCFLHVLHLLWMETCLLMLLWLHQCKSMNPGSTLTAYGCNI